MPVFKDIFFKEFKIVLPEACVSLIESLSTSADLQVFILDIMRYISWSNIVWKVNEFDTGVT